MTKYMQLCKEQREIIQHLVSNWNAFKESDTKERIKSFTQIGKAIKVDRTTVLREIKRNRYIKTDTPFNQTQISNAISRCSKLQKPPYVCNNCPQSRCCLLNKVYYNASVAQDHYEESMRMAREGIDLDAQVLEEIETSIVPLIKDKKHSVNQVYCNHKDILFFSKPTFYKYVNAGIFSLTNLDLPKKVKYKPRKHKNLTLRRELSLLENRKFSDFCIFTTLHPRMNIFEMDTVIGLINDSKVLLTIFFRDTHFMLIRLLDKKCVKCVNLVFDELKEKLGIKLYSRVFRVGLTDNGSEFFDPYHIELDYVSSKKVSNLFYCDPNRPDQKGGIEKNHEYIRKVLPKGSSFDNLTQSQINTLENNINNIPRDSLLGKTPFQLMKDKYPIFISKLDCKFINPDDVDISIKSIKEDNHDRLQRY